jgi:hypothetical protein
VGLFRRESLHERLAREGGLEQPSGGRVQGWNDLVGIHGLARQREWDAVVTAEGSGVEGREVDFVALPDGSLLVEQEEGEASLEALAAAVEEQLAPPYRARGVRQTETLWAVSARRIDVASFEAEGERVELTQTPDGRALRVDGMPAFGSVPALERFGERAGPAYAIQAERLDADLWEVRVARL